MKKPTLWEYLKDEKGLEYWAGGILFRADHSCYEIGMCEVAISDRMAKRLGVYEFLKDRVTRNKFYDNDALTWNFLPEPESRPHVIARRKEEKIVRPIFYSPLAIAVAEKNDLFVEAISFGIEDLIQEFEDEKGEKCQWAYPILDDADINHFFDAIREYDKISHSPEFKDFRKELTKMRKRNVELRKKRSEGMDQEIQEGLRALTESSKHL